MLKKAQYSRYEDFTTIGMFFYRYDIVPEVLR